MATVNCEEKQSEKCEDIYIYKFVLQLLLGGSTGQLKSKQKAGEKGRRLLLSFDDEINKKFICLKNYDGQGKNIARIIEGLDSLRLVEMGPKKRPEPKCQPIDAAVKWELDCEMDLNWVFNHQNVHGNTVYHFLCKYTELDLSISESTRRIFNLQLPSGECTVSSDYAIQVLNERIKSSNQTVSLIENLIHRKNSLNETPISILIKLNRMDTLKVLVKNLDFEKIALACLQCSCKEGLESGFKFVCKCITEKQRFDIYSVEDEYGKIPLEIAVAAYSAWNEKTRQKIIKYLIKNSVDIEAKRWKKLIDSLNANENMNDTTRTYFKKIIESITQPVTDYQIELQQQQHSVIHNTYRTSPQSSYSPVYSPMQYNQHIPTSSIQSLCGIMNSSNNSSDLLNSSRMPPVKNNDFPDLSNFASNMHSIDDNAASDLNPINSMRFNQQSDKLQFTPTDNSNRGKFVRGK